MTTRICQSVRKNLSQVARFQNAMRLTCWMRKTLLIPNVTPQHPCSRNTSSVHSGQDLDEAFLLTPYPGMCRSPNLLEKISLEIAARHQLFLCTPHPLVENSLHINDSYKQAVLGRKLPFPLPEPLALRFETSDNAVKEEESFSDKENQVAVMTAEVCQS